jgi:hypothetical protein
MKTKKTTTTDASTLPDSAPVPDVALDAAAATTKATRRKATPQMAARAAKNAPAEKKAAAAPAGSKKDTILALISRKGGASLAEIMAACSWQKHSVRGAISTMGKSTKITSSKGTDGARTYQAK